MTYQNNSIHLYSMFLGKKKNILKVYEITKSNSIINTQTERNLALGKKKPSKLSNKKLTFILKKNILSKYVYTF